MSFNSNPNIYKPAYINQGNGQVEGLQSDDEVRDGEKPVGLGRKEITEDYTLEGHVTLIAIGSISSPLTITIPSDENYLGRTVIIQDEQGNAGTHNITIETEGSETINGQSTWDMVDNYRREALYSNGNKWLI